MKNKLYISLFIALFCSLSIVANANSIVVGEIDPCDDNPGCPWVGPMLLPIELDACPDCPILVELYHRDCEPTFEVQIVSIYQGEAQGAQTDVTCSICTDINSNETLHEAYVKSFKALAQYYNHEPGDYEYILEQKSCTKYVGPELGMIQDPSYIIQYDTLNVPANTILNLYNIEAYDGVKLDESNEFIIVAHIKVCESNCCCYEVETYWDANEENITAMYVEEPCAPNANYECPEGCSGGCQDLEFNWTEANGFFKKPVLNLTDESIIKITPNPTEGTFRYTIETPLSGKLDLEVLDITGQIVATYSFTKESDIYSKEIKLHNTQGEYILRFSLNNKIIGSKKVLLIK